MQTWMLKSSWSKAAAVALALPLLFSHPAQALDTTRLWSERGAAELPLAALPDFRVLAAQVVPAVVSIQVEQKARPARGMGRPGANPGGGQDPFEFFHRYFGGDAPQEEGSRGIGSGFVIDTNGLILTNYHVVEDADVIEVTLTARDGSDHTFAAKVLGTAPEYDVALLQTDKPLGDATVAYLGDSQTTHIGDWVMAVGNPFGLSHSVSVGIISAKERREVAPSGRRGIYNFLQTDASINPGNSGGPLVNMRGEVIGINSAINAAGAGIGFAIPINMVKQMLPDLKSKGRFARSWIGIKIQPLTEELAQSYGLKKMTGALIAEVVPGGPAAAAKLREGDIILSFDGQEVRNTSDLPLYASSGGIGKMAQLRVWRDNREITAQVRLSEFPEADGSIARAGRQAPEASPLGIQIADLTPELRQQLRLAQGQGGAIIRSVDDGGIAARAGLRQGDVITNVNGRDTVNRQAVSDAVRQAKSKQMLRLKVIRGGTGLFLAIQKP